jgi:hypothetical protein
MIKGAALTRVEECRSCVHFCNDPAFLERAMPGLTSFSSAHASVRGDDGLCRRHDRYLSANYCCADFIACELKAQLGDVGRIADAALLRPAIAK